MCNLYCHFFLQVQETMVTVSEKKSLLSSQYPTDCNTHSESNQMSPHPSYTVDIHWECIITVDSLCTLLCVVGCGSTGCDVCRVHQGRGTEKTRGSC